MSYLQKARSLLILDQPFIATLLLKTEVIEDASVETAETDGEKIWYNPTFLASLTLAEVQFLLAHEVLHGAFMHCLKRGERDPDTWNRATDYAINEILDLEGIGSMPKGGLRDSNLYAQGGGSADRIYDILLKQQGKRPKPPKGKQPQSPSGQGRGPGRPGNQPSQPAKEPGKPLDKLRDAPVRTEAERKQREVEKVIDVKEAEGSARACGKLSKAMERLIKQLTKPRVDWQSVLRRFLSERARVDLSYARPNRRYLTEDFVLPSLRGERLGRIAIAVDCSGSIPPHVLRTFEAEVRMIIEDVKPSATDVIYFDAEVTHVETFGPDDTFKITPKGGGGTRFSPVFNELTKGEAPIACVFLTDLECDDFGSAPDFPVLWACTQRNGKAPFGEVLTLDMERE